MVSIPGRSGRRRRVLNEDVLSASSSHLVLRTASENVAASESRYGVAAAVENHPQITDYIPRRYRTIALLLVGGMILSAGAIAANQAALRYAMAGATNASVSVVPAESRLAAWIGAVLLLLTGAAGSVIQLMRRHRIDDVRGRYRVWRWVTLVCLAASANCVAGFHQLLASAMSQATHWTSLREGAAWWLLLVGPPLAWIGLRTLIEVVECRVAASLLILATAAYAGGLASFLNLLPGVETSWQSPTTAALTLAGHWLLLAAVVTYARHIVLDAQGLLATKAKKAVGESRRKSRHEGEPNERAEVDANASVLQFQAPKAAREKAPPVITSARPESGMKDWVDGRRRERERYQADEDEEDDQEGDADHKLTKAQRKQMRKLKTRNRAA